MVYGTTRKASIPEECVHFIMSTVDVTMTIRRDANHTGDRVAIDLPGRLVSNKYYDNEESVPDYAFDEP